MVENFIQREYLPFPFSREADFLDALSRIKDDRVRGVLVYPRAYGSSEASLPWGQGDSSEGSWMAG